MGLYILGLLLILSEDISDKSLKLSEVTLDFARFNPRIFVKGSRIFRLKF